MPKRTSRIVLAAAKLAAVCFAVSASGWFVVRAQRSANAPRVDAAPHAPEAAPVAEVQPAVEPAAAQEVATEPPAVEDEFTFFAGSKSGVPIYAGQSGGEVFNALPPPRDGMPVLLPSSKSLAPGTLVPKKAPQQP